MNGSGLVHWKSLMALIRHPYVRMLGVPSFEENGESMPLRPFLSRFEARLRTGSRMVDAKNCASDMVDEILGDLDGGPLSEDLNEETGRLLERIMDTLVSKWRTVDTLEDMASRLRDLCQLLLECGAPIWPCFPLDAECLARLMQGVIPELSDNAMANEFLSMESIFAIVHQALAEQRVPFEADPLTGLQILRHLRNPTSAFRPRLSSGHDRRRPARRALTRSAAPGQSAPSSGTSGTTAAAISSPLTPSTGSLPEQRKYFSTGRKVCKPASWTARSFVPVWWKRPSGGWNKRKKVLHPGTPPLYTSAFPMTEPPVPLYAPIIRTNAINARMKELLERKYPPQNSTPTLHARRDFSATTQGTCQEADTVMEGDDHLGVGNLLHAVLLRAFKPFLGLPVGPGALNPEELENIFREELEASGLAVNLPAQSRFMLEAAGPSRLRDFAAAQPDVLELIPAGTQRVRRV